jgi:hypothetical protein
MTDVHLPSRDGRIPIGSPIKGSFNMSALLIYRDFMLA